MAPAFAHHDGRGVDGPPERNQWPTGSADRRRCAMRGREPELLPKRASWLPCKYPECGQCKGGTGEHHRFATEGGMGPVRTALAAPRVEASMKPRAPLHAVTFVLPTYLTVQADQSPSQESIELMRRIAYPPRGSPVISPKRQQTPQDPTVYGLSKTRWKWETRSTWYFKKNSSCRRLSPCRQLGVVDLELGERSCLRSSFRCMRD